FDRRGRARRRAARAVPPALAQRPPGAPRDPGEAGAPRAGSPAARAVARDAARDAEAADGPLGTAGAGAVSPRSVLEARGAIACSGIETAARRGSLPDRPGSVPPLRRVAAHAAPGEEHRGAAEAAGQRPRPLPSHRGPGRPGVVARRRLADRR